MIIGCSLRELWNLSTTNATFLRDVSLLDDAAQYQSCVTGSVGSVVLKDSRLGTSTVAYYTGITPGSRACFVCDENSGYEIKSTINERICQSDAIWSEGPITCGMCVYICTNMIGYSSTATLHLHNFNWTLFILCMQVHKIRQPLLNGNSILLID